MIDDARLNKLYDAAAAQAVADPALATTLGIVMLTGFAHVESVERFTGPTINNTYRTHFPMPDGREWEFTLRRKDPA